MPTTVMIRGGSGRELGVIAVLKAVKKVCKKEEISCVQHIGRTVCRVTLADEKAKGEAPQP